MPHSNCRCMDVERSPIQSGDYVRYNGHIAQVTETRLNQNGEHVLTIEGGVIRSMQVGCTRVEVVPDAQGPQPDHVPWAVEPPITGRHFETIIADDISPEVWSLDDAHMTMDDIHRWASEQTIEGERIEVWGMDGASDHITIGARRRGHVSTQRVTAFQLRNARNPLMLLRVTAECAVRGLIDVVGRMREIEEQTVEQTITFNPNLIDGQSAARALGVESMRTFMAQYTARPPSAMPEYGDGEFDFENEQRW